MNNIKLNEKKAKEFLKSIRINKIWKIPQFHNKIFKFFENQKENHHCYFRVYNL